MAKTRHRGTTRERLAVVSSKLPQHSGTSPRPPRESGCCLHVDKKTSVPLCGVGRRRAWGVLFCVLPCFSGQEKVGPETRSGMRTRAELQGATRRRPWETGSGKQRCREQGGDTLAGLGEASAGIWELPFCETPHSTIWVSVF